MQKYICTLLPAYLLLFSSLYGMNYENALEKKIIVPNSLTQPNNLPLSIKNDTNSSSNMALQCRDPYRNTACCNDNSALSLVICSGCVLFKLIDTINICDQNFTIRWDSCNELWVPTKGNVCSSFLRWMTTLSIGLFSGSFLYSSCKPCCDEEESYCCLKKVNVQNGLTNETYETYETFETFEIDEIDEEE